MRAAPGIETPVARPGSPTKGSYASRLKKISCVWILYLAIRTLFLFWTSLFEAARLIPYR
jgi:hypothetical protein